MVFQNAKFFKICTALTVLLVPLVHSLGVETAEPEASLRPRNFNPHPYLYHRNTLQPINYAPAESNTLENSSPNGIYSQGPVQFPTNTNTDNENDLQNLAHPYERLALKTRNNAKPNRRLDYDDLSSSVSKKHYAFSYTVRDATSGDDFSHTQKQEDGAVKGSYKVQLPDGRTQVVKYTADNNGYKAQVTYLEGHVDNEYAEQSTQSPALPPALASAQPIYNYYKNLQDQHQHLHYSNGDYVDNKIYNQYNSYPTTTPTPYYEHSEVTPHYKNHIEVENVHIKTYNTAPHQQYETADFGVSSVTQSPNQIIVFPTTPTPFKDIRVLSTPRTLTYSTSSPYVNVVNSKSTNVLPGYDYYFDYNYKNGNAPATLSNHPKNLFVGSNNALYYKTKK